MSRRFFSVFVFFLSACAAQPTAIIAPEPTLAPTDAPLTAPTIKEKFFLRDLPGAGRHPI
ncbi:MAG: hypothetical protein HY070_01955, partial [Chloroflexi bacterium]|nr:hypothetical protein [Chloroflexota bacterium]